MTQFNYKGWVQVEMPAAVLERIAGDYSYWAHQLKNSSPYSELHLDYAEIRDLMQEALSKLDLEAGLAVEVWEDFIDEDGDECCDESGDPIWLDGVLHRHKKTIVRDEKCTDCGRYIQEGHIDCNCEKSHPEDPCGLTA